jgi:hypothetical protein
VLTRALEAARHREAIASLVTRLNIAGDRGRFDDLAACFTPDGVLEWATGRGEGRAAIAANIASGRGDRPIRLVRHHLTLFDIALADDLASATGRIGFFVIADAGPDHAGVYHDRYLRQGDAWLIARRDIEIEWQARTSRFPRQV